MTKKQEQQTEVVLSEERVDQQTGEVTKSALSLPADMMAEIDGLKDLGYSQKSEDSMIPILAILQDNSAEVKKKHPKYIDGAEAGDLIIRSLGRVIKMGDSLPPLVLQPAGFDHVWVEWKGEPGEGSPVAQYAFEERPKDSVERKDPENPDRVLWVMPNGNRLVDTRYHYANLLDDHGGTMAIVVPMGGTNHTTSRSWTAQMGQHRLPGSPKKAPSFFRAYGLRTKYRQKGEQSWFSYSVADMGWLTDEGVLRAGLSLLKAVASKEVMAETEVSVATQNGDDGIPV